MKFSPVVRHAVIALFSGVVALGYAPAAKALVISGSSLAFGESVDLTGALTLTSGPTPVASGTAPPPYANSDLLASATVGAILTTDLLEVNASSDVDGSPG